MYGIPVKNLHATTNDVNVTAVDFLGGVLGKREDAILQNGVSFASLIPAELVEELV